MPEGDMGSTGSGFDAQTAERFALARRGFRSVEKHELAHDIMNNWYVVRK